MIRSYPARRNAAGSRFARTAGAGADNPQAFRGYQHFSQISAPILFFYVNSDKKLLILNFLD